MKWHPDKNPENKAYAEEKFKDILIGFLSSTLHPKANQNYLLKISNKNLGILPQFQSTIQYLSHL